MKAFLGLVVVGLVMAAGSTASAQDAFYRYDSNAHNYHNYQYPVDGVGHYHHCRPVVANTGQALVHYYPVDLHHGCHGYSHHGCGHHGCGSHLIDMRVGPFYWTLF